MTREEALRIVNRIDRNILTDEECYVADNIFELVEPPLPSNLDEAAAEWSFERANLNRKKYYPFGFNPDDVFDAFKAGAEWIAKQSKHVCSEFEKQLKQE